VYSFEVLEHLWNPEKVLQEMVRVVKPGGFILVSCPNHFSLDLHLRKRPVVRLAETSCAVARYLQDKLTKTPFVNLIPDIDVPQVYPDCDMISSLIPSNLPGVMEQLGCRVLLLDTFYMCAHKSGDAEDLHLLKYSAKPFFKWFGDHILLHAVKK
jgi:SAM-dependent methyltransferase